ncbi:unnamed protein product [Calypogeia fissa]
MAAVGRGEQDFAQRLNDVIQQVHSLRQELQELSASPEEDSHVWARAPFVEEVATDVLQFISRRQPDVKFLRQYCLESIEPGENSREAALDAHLIDLRARVKQCQDLFERRPSLIGHLSRSTHSILMNFETIIRDVTSNTKST